MANCILVGCDMHERSLVLKIAVDRGKSIKKTWANTPLSRRKMIDDLQARARSVGALRIVLAYEACGFGFVLWDELTAAGIECHVLAPTRMAKSVKRRRRKTDEQDAEAILQMLRAYALASMLREVQWSSQEKATADKLILSLSATPRYADLAEALCWFKGVGVLTAMTVLTELGDASRFRNRREVGSYLGLTPSCNESGQADYRKGHITHQGPARVRKVLCQAIWSRIKCHAGEHAAYHRLVKRNPKKKKIAVVARLRHLAIKMCRTMLDVQRGSAPAATV